MAKKTTTQRSEEQKPKAKYRIKNWSDYNKALIGRGSLTLWVHEDVLTLWNHPEQTGKPGHPLDYHDLAIECALSLRAVYHLGLRQTQGFLSSLLGLLGVSLSCPYYTTFCRRAKTLQVSLPRMTPGKAFHMVVDATGLKIYGEGEWHVRTHGKSKRREWRKLHLGFDEATGEVVASELTESNHHEKEELPGLLEQVDDPLLQVTGDGAFDYTSCYDAITEREARAVIPPRSNAVVWDNGDADARDATIRRIQEIGRKAWKVESGYYRRCLAETGIFRLKQIFGAMLASRTLARQKTEVRIRCAALNKMTALGMPESVKISG
jgi:hypothetical protein